MNKALKILVIGSYDDAIRKNRLRFWLDPFYWSWDATVWSFFKPMLEGIVLAVFFFVRWHVWHDGSETLCSIAVIASLALALRQTYYNLICWVAGPEHGRSAFYAAGAAELAIMAGIGARHHRQHAAKGESGAVDGIVAIGATAIGVSQSALAYSAWCDETARREDVSVAPPSRAKSYEAQLAELKNSPTPTLRH